MLEIRVISRSSREENTRQVRESDKLQRKVNGGPEDTVKKVHQCGRKQQKGLGPGG